MAIPSLRLPLGTRLPWFNVEDLDGTRWTTSTIQPTGRAPVLVAFLCQHSPYVERIERHLGKAMADVASRGVTVLGIASNDTASYPSDSPPQLRAQAERAAFTFPYCLDPDQQAAKAFQASCTPEFFLFNRDWRCVYHGRYDGTEEGEEPTGRDLLDAVEATLADDVVAREQQPSCGCSIKWRAGNEPSYLFDYQSAA
jgi:peroxiredoxin